MRALRAVTAATLIATALSTLPGLAGLSVATAAAPVGASASSRSAARPATVTSAGGYVAVAPARLLDTRNGTGAPAAAVKANRGLTLQVSGRGGVPAGAAAVVLNVTATVPTGAGFVTVWPDGISRPTTSNLNYTHGATIANSVIVPLSAAGKVDLFSGSAGTVELIADVMGYYLAGSPTAAGTFAPLAPARLLDTRSGVGAAKAPVKAGKSVALTVTGRAGVPAHAAAAVLNVTVTAPTAGGHITVWGDGTAMPATSNVNFVKGQTVPNLVIAPIGANGKVDLYNGAAGTVQLVADVFGYLVAGAPSVSGATTSIAPARLLDTRTNSAFPATGVRAFGTVTLPVTGTSGVPSSGVSAVVLNVTVTQPTGGGYVSAFASGTAQPLSSNLNFGKGQTVPNLVIAPVSADGKVALYLGSAGTEHVVVDVFGYVLGSSQSAWSAAQLPDRSTADLTMGNTLYDLSCPTSAMCAAIGFYVGQNGSDGAVLAVRNGSTWSEIDAPVPANAEAGGYTVLQAVSCPAAGSCVAVGYYQDNAGNDEGLIETLSGGTWTDSIGPAPAGGTGNQSELYSVFCTAVGSCEASGTYLVVANQVLPGFVLNLSGGTWTATATPPPPNGDQAVFWQEVSCNAGTCAAAGYASDGTTAVAVIATLSGGTWTTIAAPVPAGASAADAIGKVVCPAAGQCVTAGSYRGSDKLEHGVVEWLSGGKWTPTTAPADAQHDRVDTLYAISCPTATACLIEGGTSTTVPVLLAGSGTSWTATRLPVPVDAGLAVLNGISCSSASACVAVGQYEAKGGAVRGFLESLAGGTWTAAAAANPSLEPSASSWTEVVSCAPGAAGCISVGTTTDRQGHAHELVETFVVGS